MEGGGIFCRDTTIDLVNVTLRANDAFSRETARGSGGGLAARDCDGALETLAFDRNSANQAGGVLWNGHHQVRLLGDGEFVANVGRINPFSGAIMYGLHSGLSLEGCTRFADDVGNELSLGSLCSNSRRARQLNSHKQVKERTRRELSISAAMLGISLGTVKKHRENLQRKLDCHSPADIARLAIREGLLAV